MCGAVGKSGSPISRWIIFPPASSTARARASTSKADSVPSLAIRSASRIPVMALMINLRRFGDGSLGACPDDLNLVTALTAWPEQRLDPGQGLPEVGLGGGVAGGGHGQPAQLGLGIPGADRVGGAGGQVEPGVGVLVGGLPFT